MTKTNLVVPDLAVWRKQLTAANVLSDAVAEYLRHTGNSDAERRQVVIAALRAYQASIGVDGSEEDE